MSNFDFMDDFEVPTVNTVKVTDRDDNEIVVPEDSAAFSIALDLRAKLSALEALDAANAERLARMEELKSAKEALQKQMDAIATDLHALDLEMFDYRAAKRALNNEIFTLRRNLSMALQNELNDKRLAENRLEFSKRLTKYAYGDGILQHQSDGAFILATNGRCILGDKRGAGKTLTVIASWDMNQAQRILAIVPDDVVGNFVNEINFWAPHRQVMQIGKLPKAQRDMAIFFAKQTEAFVMVMNYSATRKDKDLIKQLIDLRFDTVVMDEAHEIKNTSTAAYKMCKEIILAENCCPRCSGEVTKVATADNWSSYWKCLSCEWNSVDDADWEFLDRCSVKNVVPMTGTVILNKPQDLFAQLSLVDPVNFRELKDYLRVYCTQSMWTGKWEFKPGGLEALQKRLSGRYIARDGVKTPGQTITTHDIDLDAELYPDQHRVIQQLTKHAQLLLESGKKMDILATIALITRKRQANVWPAGIQLKDEDGNVIFNVGEEVTESAKIDKVIRYDNVNDEWEGLLPEFTEDGDMELGSRVVVFSQFKGPLKELERRCNEAGIDVVRFDGDTPQGIRDMARQDFDRKVCDQPGYEKKWQVILCNYRTGGVGLNFTGATEMIILDEEWSPGKADQAFGRIDRLGQTEHTNVHIIRMSRTIDTWMVQLNQEKADLIAGFNEVAEPLSTKLLDAMKNGDML